MSDTSSESLGLLIEQAERALHAGDQERAWDLAQQVRQADGAAQELQARAAIVLASAALRMGSPDIGRAHLSDAESLGADAATLASVRGDIERLSAADGALEGGVKGPEETRVILTAANEAIRAGAPQQAVELLRPIFETVQSDESQLPDAAYALGKALLDLGQADEALEWAQFSLGYGRADAQALIDDIKQLKDATSEAADGVQFNEQEQVFRAADEAYNRGDHHTALELYGSVYDSPALKPSAKGACAFNIAQCHRNLSNYELARAWYEEYLRINPDSKYAAEVAQNLENMEALAHLTEALPVE